MPNFSEISQVLQRYHDFPIFQESRWRPAAMFNLQIPLILTRLLPTPVSGICTVSVIEQFSYCPFMELHNDSSYGGPA